MTGLKAILWACDWAKHAQNMAGHLILSLLFEDMSLPWGHVQDMSRIFPTKFGDILVLILCTARTSCLKVSGNAMRDNRIVRGGLQPSGSWTRTSWLSLTCEADRNLGHLLKRVPCTQHWVGQMMMLCILSILIAWLSIRIIVECMMGSSYTIAASTVQALECLVSFSNP